MTHQLQSSAEHLLGYWLHSMVQTGWKMPGHMPPWHSRSVCSTGAVVVLPLHRPVTSTVPVPRLFFCPE